MGYVIYDKATTRTAGKYSYKTHAAAQAAITRWSKIWFRERWMALYPTVDRSEDPEFIYGIAEEGYFRKNIEKRRMVVNIMTGVETTEPVNTPNYMSVGSEAYWSM